MVVLRLVYQLPSACTVYCTSCRVAFRTQETEFRGWVTFLWVVTPWIRCWWMSACLRAGEQEVTSLPDEPSPAWNTRAVLKHRFSQPETDSAHMTLSFWLAVHDPLTLIGCAWPSHYDWLCMTLSLWLAVYDPLVLIGCVWPCDSDWLCMTLSLWLALHDSLTLIGCVIPICADICFHHGQPFVFVVCSVVRYYPDIAWNYNDNTLYCIFSIHTFHYNTKQLN